MGSTIECVSTVPVAEAGSRGLHRVLVSACSAASTGELCGVCGSACVVTQIIESPGLRVQEVVAWGHNLDIVLVACRAAERRTSAFQ